MHAPLHEIERRMREGGREPMRAIMQAHFDQRSAEARKVEVRDANDVERQRSLEGRRTVRERPVNRTQDRSRAQHSPA